MTPLYACSSFSPEYHIAERGCVAALPSKASRIHSVVKTCKSRKPINCSQRVSFIVASKIRNSQSINTRNCKSFERYRTPVTLQDGYALKPEDDDYATSFQDVLCKKLDAFCRFIRPHTVIGTMIGITSVSLLPVTNIADLTPTFFKGLLKALVPSVLMNIYTVGINQLFDLEIDKINKPDRPLVSGELSKGTAITIVCTSLLLSLAMGIMFKSPPQFSALLVHGLLGTAYSVDLPFLRWKRNAFLAASCIVIQMAFSIQFAFFIHMQKYVLGRPIVITRSLIFAIAFMGFFTSILAIFKDIPDVDGDREFGIQSLSVSFGQERVFWLCVQMMLMAYGAAVMVGVSLSFLSSKLVIILGHSLLACFLWLRARSTDLSSVASLNSFYLFIWKLFYAEYLLIPFVR